MHTGLVNVRKCTDLLRDQRLKIFLLPAISALLSHQCWRRHCICAIVYLCVLSVCNLEGALGCSLFQNFNSFHTYRLLSLLVIRLSAHSRSMISIRSLTCAPPHEIVTQDTISRLFRCVHASL